MKPIFQCLSCLLLTAAVAPLCARAQSGPPGQIAYQGFLADANGQPLSTIHPQNLNVVFKIYNDPSSTLATNLLWAEQQVITVDRGYYTATLGGGSAYGGFAHTNNLAGLFNAPDASARYLGVTVVGLTPANVEISPRLQLLAAPFAYLAATAISANTAGYASNALTATTATAATSAGTAGSAASAGFATAANYANYTTNLIAGGGLWNVSGPNYYTTNTVAIGTNNGAQTLTVTGGEYVFSQGGASAPPALSVINGSSWNSPHLDFGVATGNAYWNSSAVANDGVIRTSGNLLLQSGYGGAAMTISTNNYVGIGTTTPTAPLQVVGATSIYEGSYQYINRTGFGHTGQSINYSMYLNGSLACNGEVDVNSDLRLKTVLRLSDAAQDTRTLMGIAVTDYRYKDTLANGDQISKKVIAQQVETVYPEAVNRKPGVVPDIMKGADLRQGWVGLPNNLAVGDRVKLLQDGKSDALCTVVAVEAGRFRVDGRQSDGRVFVYGREVPDLRSVDYDALAMLNVSVSQELSRKIASRRDELAALRAKLTALQSGDAARETALERLEDNYNRSATHSVRASLETK